MPYSHFNSAYRNDSFGFSFLNFILLSECDSYKSSQFPSLPAPYDLLAWHSRHLSTVFLSLSLSRLLLHQRLMVCSSPNMFFTFLKLFIFTHMSLFSNSCLTRDLIQLIFKEFMNQEIVKRLSKQINKYVHGSTLWTSKNEGSPIVIF